MNIIFAVQNRGGWNSVISSKFGRAEGFICYSEEDDKLSYHSNKDNKNVGHGAGINAGQSAINLEAFAVITGGSMGPKAFELLKSAEIKMFTQVGEISVLKAYENYKNDKYQEVLRSDK